MTEKEIHQGYIAYLNRKRLCYRHDRMDKRTTTKVGEPDFAVHDGGRTLFVEFKRLGGKLRPEQKKRKDEYESAGMRVVLAFTVEEAVHATELWLGRVPCTTQPFFGHPSRPLDCQGISGGGKGKADSR